MSRLTTDITEAKSGGDSELEADLDRGLMVKSRELSRVRLNILPNAMSRFCGPGRSRFLPV